MKRILKSTISILLILVMILSSFTVVFAGSSSSGGSEREEEERRKREQAERERLEALKAAGNAAEGKMADNIKDALNYDVYCLNIDTGIVSRAAKLKYILISYTGPTGHETIMLEPSYYEKDNAANNLRYGSYAQTLNYMNSVIKTTNPDLETNLKQSGNFVGLDLSLKADPDEQGGYFPAESNIDVYFKPKFKMTYVDKVMFYFSDTVEENGNKISNGDQESRRMYSWTINSISLYNLGVSESVFTSKDPGIAYYSYSLATKQLYSTFTNATLVAKLEVQNGASGDMSWQGDQLVVIQKKLVVDQNGNMSTRGSNIPSITPFVLENLNTKSSLLDSKQVDPASVAHAVVALDIADVYGAGMDSMCAPVGGKLAFVDPPKVGSGGAVANVTDPLVASIAYYTALDGKYPDESSVKYVDIPVMTNFMLYWARNLGDSKDKVSLIQSAASKIVGGNMITVAQQGETIALPVSLPNFVAIKEVNLKYENGADFNDSLTFNGINVYLDKDYYPNMDTTFKFTSTAENGQILITPDPENYPMYIGRIGSTKSLSLYPSGQTDIDFLDNPENPETGKREAYSAPAYETRDKYLITFKTPNLDIAGTKDDILINFSYYTTKNMEATTEDFEVRNNLKDFYGYWMGLDEDENKVDAPYYVGMSKKGELRMIVELRDVGQFTGFTIKGSPSMEDEYQLGGLKIEKLSYLSSRRMTRISETEYNGVRVDRKYDRTYEGTVLFDKDGLNMLIQKGDVKTYEFLSQKVKKEKQVRDFTDQEYDMDFDTANGELGFTDAVTTYEVQFNVASNNVSATRDDDCGSNNLFYVQLCFQKGHTGYVLANDQFSADGFRAGATETIGFSTNQDFGNVTGINIIPDDLDENSDILDKLNLDSIKIIKHNEGTVDQVYTIENVGWVCKEYKSSASRGYASSGGRSSTEMICYYPIGSASYSLTLEFTLRYASNVKEENTNVAEGGVLMDLTYTNTNGEVKTLQNVDVAKAMYEYQAGSPKLKDDRIITNKNSMLRPGTADRFFVHIDDATSLIDATLNLYGTARAYLWLKGCHVRAIYGDRELKINNDGEYEYDFDEEPIDICDARITDPIEMCFTGNGQTDHYMFKFEENELPKVDSENKLVPPVPRVPESSNDFCRVFLYLAPNSVSPDSVKGLAVELTYTTTVYDYVSQEFLNYAGVDPASGRKVYTADVWTQKMSDLKNLTIMMDSAPGNDTYIFNDAVIMQIRQDVVVTTYHVPMGTTGISNAMRSASANGVPEVITENGKQKLMIHLAADSDSYHLYPETHDVEICIKYLTACEHLEGATIAANEYVSPNIFLTDQQIEEIHAGSMVTLEFSIPYMYELVEIDMLATGGIDNAQVDAIFGLVYNEDESLATTFCVDHTEKPVRINDNIESANKPNIPTGALTDAQRKAAEASGVQIEEEETPGTASKSINKKDGITRFVPTSEVFTPVIMTLGTAGTLSDVTSTPSGPIKCTLYYQKDEYQDIVNIDDLGSFSTDCLQNWISTGSFDAGDTAEVWLPLKSIYSLRYVDFEATDGVSWGLYSLKVQLLDPQTGEFKLLADLQPNLIMTSKNSQRINFSQVSLLIDAAYTTVDIDNKPAAAGLSLESDGIDPKTGKPYVTPLTKDIAVKDQTEVQFKGTPKQSVEGYRCTLGYYDTNDTYVEDVTGRLVDSNKIFRVGDVIEFRANSSTGIKKYKLEFTSVEDSDCVVVFNVGIVQPQSRNVEHSFDTDEAGNMTDLKTGTVYTNNGDGTYKYTYTDSASGTQVERIVKIISNNIYTRKSDGNYYDEFNVLVKFIGTAVYWSEGEGIYLDKNGRRVEIVGEKVYRIDGDGLYSDADGNSYVKENGTFVLVKIINGAVYRPNADGTYNDPEGKAVEISGTAVYWKNEDGTYRNAAGKIFVKENGSFIEKTAEGGETAPETQE